MSRTYSKWLATLPALLVVAGCEGHPPTAPAAPSAGAEIGAAAAAVQSSRTDSKKITICHAVSDRSYQPLSIGTAAEPAHRAHGDAAPGEPVPGMPLMVFDERCSPIASSLRITSGTWQVDSLGVALFDVNGPDIALKGRWGYALSLLTCSRCTAGQTITVNALFDNPTPQTDIPQATGSATIGGVQYGPPIEFGGPLRFVTDPFILPAPASFGDAVVVKTPFTMSGQLKGYLVVGRRDPELAFEVPVSGHGTATVVFLSGQIFWRVSFDFEE